MTAATDAALAVVDNVDPEGLGKLIDTCGKIIAQTVPIIQWVLDNLLRILQAVRGMLGT